MKITTLILLFMTSLAMGQSFHPGIDMFSHKKPAYLILTDGTKMDCEIDRLVRKRNNIAGIDVKIDGKKKSFAPEELKEMYLPINELNKFSTKMEAATNISKDINLDVVNEGYGFYENTLVDLKGKVQPLMMQLVNPGFSNKIKVYFDPMAMETMSMSVGPLKAGGIDRSYFIKMGEAPAFKISKANYSEKMPEMFGDCPSIIKDLGRNPEWKDLAEHVFRHANCNE